MSKLLKANYKEILVASLDDSRWNKHILLTSSTKLLDQLLISIVVLSIVLLTLILQRYHFRDIY